MGSRQGRVATADLVALLARVCTTNGTRLKVNDVEIDEDDWELVVGEWEVLAALEIPPEQ